MPKLALAAFAAAIALAAPARAATDTVRLAYIDPLSGPFAETGDVGLKHFRFAADKINEAGGVDGGKRLEVVGFDDKTNPKDALIQLQKAIDGGIHYVVQGQGSAVGLALSEAIAKHNARNPDDRVLYLNYAAADPVMTNAKCNFWHFRFEADADMKMLALARYVATQPQIKKIYLFNQDYSFGHSVADAATAMLQRTRPDITIVGDEFVPLGKVKDFAPYVSKIAASGADAVITGNWGPDMTLFVKAVDDAGLNVPILALYGGSPGAVPAMGKAAVGRVIEISEAHQNIAASPQMTAMMNEIVKTYHTDMYFFRALTLVDMLAKAMDETKSTDPTKVAYALEGMTITPPYGGEATIRKDNHQLIEPLYVSILSDKAPRTVEGTPYGFVTVTRIDGKDTELPTTCHMQRPD